MDSTQEVLAGLSAVVAVPAKDEAGQIGACLAALAVQRDGAGMPLPAGTFGILVYANNCRDETATVARSLAAVCPHPIAVVSETTPSGSATAGWARGRAMDLAAACLRPGADRGGALLTTDADSRVGPEWVSATLRALATGVDGVAGYIDGEPGDLMSLGPAFLRRGRLEDHYLRCVAEIDARCDPRPHNPWPTHRVSSGASLAVTRDAYRAIGGVPDRAIGEDVALTRALERQGFAVRFAMDVVVTTSCRLESRVTGGAADTMRARHAEPDLPCGDGIEPAALVLRRAIAKGQLRRAHAGAGAIGPGWARRLGLSRAAAARLAGDPAPFPDLWERVVLDSPVLAAARALRPSEIPAEIVRAERMLQRLRALPDQARSSRSSL